MSQLRRFAALSLVLVACSNTDPDEASLDLGNAPPVTGIAKGSSGACAIRGKDLLCWGNRPGQFYRPTPTKIELADGKSPRTIVGRGAEHICVLTTDETVQCWSNPNFGLTISPTDMGLRNVQSLYGSGDRYCGVLNDGSTYCWNIGKNTEQAPQRVRFSAHPKKIILGTEYHFSIASVCAHTASDGVECVRGPDWTQPSELMPGLESGVTSLDGSDTACAVVNQKIKCWGSRDSELYGEYRNGSASPVAVKGLDGSFTKVLIQMSQGYAITDDGDVVSWGEKDRLLADGETVSSLPVRVRLSAKAVELTSDHYTGGVCATLANGAMACIDLSWIQAAPSDVVIPSVFPGLNQDVVSPAIGDYGLCGIVRGRLRCVGGSDQEPLGHPSKTSSSTVIDVL